MLSEHVNQLQQRLKTGLSEIAGKKLVAIAQLRDQLALIRELTAELSSWVSGHPFADQAAEIHYYKQIYPEFKAQQIYHVELYNMQLNAPRESPVLLAAHYKLYFSSLIDQLDNFRFYQLYRKLGGSELDELFFTRSGAAESALLPVLAESDSYGTEVGYLYARFLAAEMLWDFIAGELEKMAFTGGGKSEKGSRFKWTGKTIDLIEVAHGLHLQGAVGNGEIGIVDFFSAFGEFFGVDLGIPKKGLDNLMDRKTVGRTRFTDQMRQALHGKMDELEAYDPDRRIRKMGL